jgi:hypothetical protein
MRCQELSGRTEKFIAIQSTIAASGKLFHRFVAAIIGFVGRPHAHPATLARPKTGGQYP